MNVYVVNCKHETWGPLQKTFFYTVADGGNDVAGVLAYAGAKDGGDIVFGDGDLDLFEKDCGSLDGFGTEGTLESGELEAGLDVVFEDAG